jgi:hypothetical protein
MALLRLSATGRWEGPPSPKVGGFKCPAAANQAGNDPFGAQALRTTFVFWRVGLLEDAELVYEALAQRSPQDVRELARSSGIGGERLQMAVVWLELRGRVERDFDIDEERTRSFSSVRVKAPA